MPLPDTIPPGGPVCRCRPGVPGPPGSPRPDRLADLQLQRPIRSLPGRGRLHLVHGHLPLRWQADRDGEGGRALDLRLGGSGGMRKVADHRAQQWPHHPGHLPADLVSLPGAQRAGEHLLDSLLKAVGHRAMVDIPAQA